MGRRKKKKKPLSSMLGSNFADLYKLTGDILGEGSYGLVQTCKSVYSGLEYAVKIIEKRPGSFLRSKLLKEIEIYHMCSGQDNIIQLVEFFEEEDKFYLVFEKLHGGPLLEHIQRRKFLGGERPGHHPRPRQAQARTLLQPVPGGLGRLQPAAAEEAQEQGALLQVSPSMSWKQISS